MRICEDDASGDNFGGTGTGGLQAVERMGQWQGGWIGEFGVARRR